MANNEILQIVVFSMFFGIARGLAGEKFNAPLVAALNVVSHTTHAEGPGLWMCSSAGYFAPSHRLSPRRGWAFLNYASFIGGYYIAVLLTSAVLLAVGYMVLKKEVFRLLNMLKDPVLVAFTALALGSVSEDPGAAGQFGCSRNIVSFVLPIGYSFNLVGSMVYCSFASMFIAQNITSS